MQTKPNIRSHCQLLLAIGDTILTPQNTHTPQNTYHCWYHGISLKEAVTRTRCHFESCVYVFIDNIIPMRKIALFYVGQLLGEHSYLSLNRDMTIVSISHKIDCYSFIVLQSAFQNL